MVFCDGYGWVIVVKKYVWSVATDGRIQILHERMYFVMKSAISFSWKNENIALNFYLKIICKKFI